VVAFKLDRLFRDAADCLVVTKAWDRANVALHLVDLGGQAIDTSSTMGRFFLTMMAGVAEMERNMIRDRTAVAMARKQERGEYTGGQCPFGWRLAADGTHLEPDAAEQAMIAAARRWQAAGLSLRKIGTALAADGYLPRGGGQWAASSVKCLLAAEVAA
jgi:DNA invertase Pin-like site-specific DNA recombinase